MKTKLLSPAFYKRTEQLPNVFRTVSVQRGGTPTPGHRPRVAKVETKISQLMEESINSYLHNEQLSPTYHVKPNTFQKRRRTNNSYLSEY